MYLIKHCSCDSLQVPVTFTAMNIQLPVLNTSLTFDEVKQNITHKYL